MSAPGAPVGHIDDIDYCGTCGSAYWVPEAVNINISGQVTGYTFPVRCHECGAERAVA